MKRRSFLLSIPLIAGAVKALGKPVKPEFNVKVLQERAADIRKYPLTEKEAYPSKHIGVITKIDQVSEPNPRCVLEIEFKGVNNHLINATLTFQSGDFGIVTDHYHKVITDGITYWIKPFPMFDAHAGIITHRVSLIFPKLINATVGQQVAITKSFYPG